MRRVDKEELNFSHGIIVNAYQRYTVGSKEDLHRKLDFSVILLIQTTSTSLDFNYVKPCLDLVQL